MALTDLARRAAKLAVDNSPTILTSVGVVGTLTTAYLAGKASFQVGGAIAAHNAEVSTGPEMVMTPREIVEFVTEEGLWKLYISPAVMALATVTCIIGANKVGARRAAGLAAGYTIVEKSFEEYRDKVVEKFGERKEQAVHDEIAQDRINATYSDDVRLLGVSEGEICYDSFGGQYFLNSVEGINAAINVLNNLINNDGFASLADLYRLLEMETPPFSESIGWNSDRLLEPRISSTLAHGSKPIVVMGFSHEPMPDYGRFR